MSKLILLFAVLLSFTDLSAAADNGAEASIEPRLERLSNELQLTADQKARLEAIFNEKHEKIRMIREETQSRIKDVLSEEQLEKWDELKK